MIPSLPLYPQILPFSLPLPTSLLQPHSLLTVWQHQSHLTSELLPSTWVFFPQRATWFIPYLLSYCSNVGFSVRSSLTTPYKKALVHPQSQILQGNIFQKVFPNFSFPHLPQSGKFFLPSKSLYLTFLVIYWFYLVLQLLGPYSSHYTLGSWREGTVSSSFLFSLSTIGTVNT